MKTIYLRAGTEHIAFEWVHRHMAEALAAGEPQFELRLQALLEALPRELQADVDSGRLPVKDPLTMGPNSFNIGGALDSARVLVSDLRNYVAHRGIEVVEMPEVIRRARVLCIDPALTNFPRNARMHYTDCIGTGSGSGGCSVGDFIDSEKERVQRQAEGYFTVDEAAQVLADSHPSIDVKSMAKRLETATVNGLRLARNSGDLLPIVNDKDFRVYMSVVKVSDVDAWLESQGVEYRFPKTESRVAIGAKETVAQRGLRHLELFEAEEESGKRGALQRLANRVKVDRSKMGKAIKNAREVCAEKTRSGNWSSQLVQDGKRKG